MRSYIITFQTAGTKTVEATNFSCKANSSYVTFYGEDRRVVSAVKSDLIEAIDLVVLVDDTEEK